MELFLYKKASVHFVILSRRKRDENDGGGRKMVRVIRILSNNMRPLFYAFSERAFRGEHTFSEVEQRHIEGFVKCDCHLIIEEKNTTRCR